MLTVSATSRFVVGLAVAPGVTGCVQPIGPTRTARDYELKAADTAEMVLSAVRTAEPVVDVGARGLSPHVSVALDDVSGRAVFDLVRERLGAKIGLVHALIIGAQGVRARLGLIPAHVRGPALLRLVTWRGSATEEVPWTAVLDVSPERIVALR